MRSYWSVNAASASQFWLLWFLCVCAASLMVVMMEGPDLSQMGMPNLAQRKTQVREKPGGHFLL